MKRISIMRNSAEPANFFKSMSGKLRASCAVAALGLLAATSASAAAVTYSFELQSFNATLDGVSYSGPMTIVAQGDTNNLQIVDGSSPGFTYVVSYLVNMTATVNLAGFGTFSILAPVTVWSGMWDDGAGYAGSQIGMFGGSPDGFDFGLGPTGSANYDVGSLASGGPVGISADAGWFNGYNTETTAGIFNVTELRNGSPRINGTFTAVVQADANAVPEPDSLALFGGAGVALLLAARRRKPATLAN
jgi:hypothetical protein